MGLADNIRANRSKSRTKIIVEAWGDDDGPAVIFSSPLTAGDISRIQRKHKDFLSNTSVEAMIDLIILKAESEDGDKAFSVEDRPVLMRENLNVISEVAGQMFGDIDSIEDLEKN
jgi:hypothetical protein